MKKNFLLAAGMLCSLLVVNNVRAQDNKNVDVNDVKGVNFLNAGIGIGTYGLSGTGGLPVTVSFEHGFNKNISAGITAGFVKRSFATEWKYNYLIFGARASYHFNEMLKIANPKLDVYGGTGLIYRHYSVKFTNSDGGGVPDYKASGSDITLDLHAGGRYFFNKHVGIFAELGYGISPLQLGATFQF